RARRARLPVEPDRGAARPLLPRAAPRRGRRRVPAPRALETRGPLDEERRARSARTRPVRVLGSRRAAPALGTPRMSGPAPVAAIVVHYFGGDALTRCLASLACGSRVPERITVVDNGSEPGWRESLKSEFPGVEVITLDRNHGFAGALTGD